MIQPSPTPGGPDHGPQLLRRTLLRRPGRGHPSDHAGVPGPAVAVCPGPGSRPAVYDPPEVSSQAYQVERVYGEHFDIGVFLNFSEDHISPKEHASMEEYLQCKLQLLENSGQAFAIRPSRLLPSDEWKRIRKSFSLFTSLGIRTQPDAF